MRLTLPMYDLPELRAQTDRWTACLLNALAAEGFEDLPEALDRKSEREAAWRAPDLLLTQTCGFPLRHGMAGVLSAVAVPVYAAEGCRPGFYASAVLVRTDDPARAFPDCRGYRVAANGPDSQSGANCLRALAAPLAQDGAFFGEVTWSRAHRNSLALVKQGKADLCAVDAVTLALIDAVAPDETKDLRRLCWSPEAPALPYAVRATLPAETRTRVAAALRRALDDPDGRAARRALLLEDLQPIDDAAYASVVTMREQADRAGLTALT